MDIGHPDHKIPPMDFMGANTPAAMPKPIKVYKKRGPKKALNEIERRAKLEADEWAGEVQPTSVKCLACERTIKLDRRSTYYPGLWIKHRDKCQELKRHLALRLQVKFPRLLIKVAQETWSSCMYFTSNSDWSRSSRIAAGPRARWRSKIRSLAALRIKCRKRAASENPRRLDAIMVSKCRSIAARSEPTRLPSL